MKRKMRKIICVLMVILMVLSTGCSAESDVDTKMEVKYCTSKVKYGEATADEFIFSEIIGDDVVFESFNDEVIEYLEELEKDLYDYLVEEFDLDWKFVHTDIRALNFATISEGKYTLYAAMADPTNKTVYMNTMFVQSGKDLVYRVVHELIHCLRSYNTGTVEYVFENAEGQVIGYYVGESYTDIVAAGFLETLGEETPLDYFLLGSSYCYSTVALQIVEYSIPNATKMYLENDMQSYYEALKKLTQEHIKDGNEVDYAEKFLYHSDLIIYATTDLLDVATIDEFKTISRFLLNAMYGNFEIALSVSDSLDKKGEEEVFELVKHMFELEGESEEIDKRLDYLKTCLK